MFNYFILRGKLYVAYIIFKKVKIILLLYSNLSKYIPRTDFRLLKVDMNKWEHDQILYKQQHFHRLLYRDPHICYERKLYHEGIRN